MNFTAVDGQGRGAQIETAAEPKCAVCGKPMFGRCLAEGCNKLLCQDHIANLDVVLNLGDWPACIHHVEEVTRANMARWSEQWAKFGGEA